MRWAVLLAIDMREHILIWLIKNISIDMTNTQIRETKDSLVKRNLNSNRIGTLIENQVSLTKTYILIS